jgi:ribonuclease PH
VQGTAEGMPFSADEMVSMLDLARVGMAQIIAAQNAVLAAE